MKIKKNPSIVLLYHYFYPDEVVSSKQFSDFAVELVRRNWDVTVLTSNRLCHYPKKKIDKKTEIWQGVKILRVNRPSWRTITLFSRMLNSLWLIWAWSIKILAFPKVDVVVVGSDPQLSQLIFPILKLFNRQKKIVYWCFDLYPEATIANDAKGIIKLLAKVSEFIVKRLYRCVDLIVDLGECMRSRLDKYNHGAQCATLTPWALAESSDENKQDQNNNLFKISDLNLLYSGNMGRAHDHRLFFELARRVSGGNQKIIFNFACKGSRMKEVLSDIKSDDENIQLIPLVELSELEKRLKFADMHLVSLREGWDGLVVPSKFFGALAVGKPVLYSGPENSSIASWIEKFDLGIVLTHQNIDKVADLLLNIPNNPEILEKWSENARKTYYAYFSKEKVMNKWDEILRDLII